MTQPYYPPVQNNQAANAAWSGTSGPFVLPNGEQAVTGPNGNCVVRGGRYHYRATKGRAWAARLIDAVLLVALTAGVIGASVSTLPATTSDDLKAALMVLPYPVFAILLGMLYGTMCSPGQAVCGVVSLRCRSGRRVGAWRGMWRYLAIAFFPVTLLAALDLPTTWEEDIRVYDRRPMA